MARRAAVRDDERTIIEGWVKVSKGYKTLRLNDQEKAQIDRARLADEQAKKSVFTLGGPANIG